MTPSASRVGSGRYLPACLMVIVGFALVGTIALFAATVLAGGQGDA